MQFTAQPFRRIAKASKTKASKTKASKTKASSGREYRTEALQRTPFNRPSVNLHEAWVRAYGPAYSSMTRYVGKWMLFVPGTAIDEVWAKIEEATAAGELGLSAKVSTLLNNQFNPRAQGAQTHAIMVYTGDCRDVEDVARVLQRLRDLGFVGRLSYKEDGATYADLYGPGAALYVAAPGSIQPDRRREAIPVPPEKFDGYTE